MIFFYFYEYLIHFTVFENKRVTKLVSTNPFFIIIEVSNTGNIWRVKY